MNIDNIPQQADSDYDTKYFTDNTSALCIYWQTYIYIPSTPTQDYKINWLLKIPEV